MTQNSISVFTTASDGKIWGVEVCDALPDLTWETRPNMEGSGATEALQMVWTAVVMAHREAHGAISTGQCVPINIVAQAIAEKVLGEPVELCAGFAFFATGKGPADGADFGRRHCPDKWRKALGVGAPIFPAEHDHHVWLETKTHLIDFTTFQIAPMMRRSNLTFSVKGAEGTWPPMIYWQKRDLPTHPRDAWGDRKLLLWRKREALALLSPQVREDMLAAVGRRPFEIFEALESGLAVKAAESDIQRLVLG